jgi:hypothetical protein
MISKFARNAEKVCIASPRATSSLDEFQQIGVESFFVRGGKTVLIKICGPLPMATTGLFREKTGDFQRLG